MLARLGLERVVLVQPSFTRHRQIPACWTPWRRSRTRAASPMLPPQVSDDELDALDDAGIRGLRVNIATDGTAPIETIRRDLEAAARILCERYGWHVQIFIGADLLRHLSPILLASPVATVIDHFGLIAPDTSLKADPAVALLLRLLHSDKIWCKITCYLIADDPNDARIGPLAKRLCADQSRAHRLGLGLAACAPARSAHRRTRRGTAVPADRHARPARPGAAFVSDDALVHRVHGEQPGELYGF